MSTLLDVLLLDEMDRAFSGGISRPFPSGSARPIPDPTGEGDPAGNGGRAVRIERPEAGALVLTPRGLHGEQADGSLVPVARWEELVGYDWICRDLDEKVRLRDRFGDRIFLVLRESREVVLDGLGSAVFPLMAFLGKVLEIRSRKLVLEHLTDEEVDLISRSVAGAAEGGYFEDSELPGFFEQDRDSLRVVAGLWTRMNLLSPDLARTLIGVLEMLPQRRDRDPADWRRRFGDAPSPLEEVRAHLAVLTGLPSD